MLNTKNFKMIADQNCIDFGTKSFRFGQFSGPSYREAHSGWRAAWLGGWGRPAGHMGCMVSIQVGVAHERFRAARLAQSAPWGSPWPSMLGSNGFSEWGRPAGHMWCMLFIQVGVAHKRFRAARFAQSAPWRSPWPSLLEGNAFSEWGRPAGHMWCMLFI